MKFRSHILTIVLTASPAQGALVAVSGYVYATNAESQPQPTTFVGGALSDVGNVKLTDGVLATGSWNDGTNVGFRNLGGDSGNPQPRVTFDLGVLHTVSTVDIWTDYFVISRCSCVRFGTYASKHHSRPNLLETMSSLLCGIHAQGAAS